MPRAYRTLLPLLTAALLGGSPVSACSNARTPPPSETGARADTLRLAIEPIGEIAGASHSGIEERRRMVVRSEPQWRDLWGELAAGRIPPPEAPVIDFETRMVIVAAMGQRPTGGYAISIEEVLATPDSLYVTVVETSPGAGCLTTQALTAPVAAVSVERHPGAPIFREREEVRDCG